MAILKAILSGARDPQKLAPSRARRCQHGEAESTRALQGNWRAEHLFALQQAVALSEFSHRQISACVQQIEAPLQPLAEKSEGKALPPRPRKCKRRATEPRLDARPPLLRLAGVDLTAIEGMDEYEQTYRERTIQNLVRKAKALGYKLLPATDLIAQEVLA
jgi:transposase